MISLNRGIIMQCTSLSRRSPKDFFSPQVYKAIWTCLSVNDVRSLSDLLLAGLVNRKVLVDFRMEPPNP